MKHISIGRFKTDKPTYIFKFKFFKWWVERGRMIKRDVYNNLDERWLQLEPEWLTWRWWKAVRSWIYFGGRTNRMYIVLNIDCEKEDEPERWSSHYQRNVISSRFEGSRPWISVLNILDIEWAVDIWVWNWESDFSCRYKHGCYLEIYIFFSTSKYWNHSYVK